MLPGPLSPEMFFTTLCRAFSSSLDPLWHVVGRTICQCELWIRAPSSIPTEASPWSRIVQRVAVQITSVLSSLPGLWEGLHVAVQSTFVVSCLCTSLGGDPRFHLRWPRAAPLCRGAFEAIGTLFLYLFVSWLRFWPMFVFFFFATQFRVISV